jgi:hypothetical protein
VTKNEQVRLTGYGWMIGESDKGDTKQAWTETQPTTMTEQLIIALNMATSSNRSVSSQTRSSTRSNKILELTSKRLNAGLKGDKRGITVYYI